MIKINVLGTDYDVFYRGQSEDKKLEQCGGYVDTTIKAIVVDKFDSEDPMDMEDLAVVQDKILRHEIVHAFMFESGLDVECEWANNEMLIDWIALQIPKMYKAIQGAR